MRVISFQRLIVMWLVAVTLYPMTSPAPLIYVPGEGWSYVRAGESEASRWRRPNATEQIQVSKDADEAGSHRLARKSSKRILEKWPFSDHGAEAQFYIAKSYDDQRNFNKAAKEYKTLLVKYPQTERFATALERQYEIASYLAGKGYFKLWGWIPLPNAMYPKDSVVDIYNQTIDEGPFYETGPKAQMKIGETREKQKRFSDAVRAFEVAADRYHYKPDYAANALYKAGQAYYRQVRRAEYDQSVADRAVKTFEVFTTFFPSDPRSEEAEEIIQSIRTEQSRGNYQIAKFYEARRRWEAAKRYYNAAIAKDNQSIYADMAREEVSKINDYIESRNNARSSKNSEPESESEENPSTKSNSAYNL